MRRKTWLIIAAVQVALIFVLASVALGAKQKGPGDEPLVPRWWERPQLIRKLDLSENQISKIREIFRMQSRTISQARNIFIHERQQLRDLLVRDTLDDDAVQERVTAMESAFSALFKTELEMHYTMLKELDPDQRKIVVESIEQQRPKAHHIRTKKEDSERKKLDKRYNRF